MHLQRPRPDESGHHERTQTVELRGFQLAKRPPDLVGEAVDRDVHGASLLVHDVIVIPRLSPRRGSHIAAQGRAERSPTGQRTEIIDPLQGGVAPTSPLLCETRNHVSERPVYRENWKGTSATRRSRFIRSLRLPATT